MHRKGLLLAAFTVAVSGFCAADGSAQDVASLVAQLRASEAETRRSAFYGLLGGRVPKAGPTVVQVLESHPSKREQITVALIDALHMENARLRAFPQTMGEADGQYYGDLIWAVGSLRDGRAVEALMPALGTGRLAAQGLADLGRVALPPVVEELRGSPREMVRAGAAQALGLMVGGDSVSLLDREDVLVIRSELLRALDDGSGHVRAMAARALIHFPDPEVGEAMEHLAVTDPFVRPPDGGTFYPVRQAAREWLEKHGGDATR